ncbi:MAG: hypothetical protein JO032_02565 [Alphaproteobacteria bacterium]|nr:hypothetical protein [Alphaproteobacteria bacterium]
MTSAWAEARLALIGALRLARADPRGIVCFDRSEEGFWRSFRAGMLAYPLYLILLSFPLQIGDAAAQIDAGRYFAAETIHYVISWVAFPLLMLPLVDRLQRSERFFLFMTAYNWCQVPQTVVFAAVALLGGVGVLSADGMVIADLIAGLAALLYEWYVARVALAVSGGRAVFVIVVDIVLAAALSHVSAALYQS